MIKIRVYFLFFLTLVLTTNKSFATNFKSYQPLSPEIISKLNFLIFPALKSDQSIQSPPAGLQSDANYKDQLIQENLNQNWKKPSPPTEVNTIKPYSPAVYAEGTGTRGGGSGLIIRTTEKNEVKLLEVFRSENLQIYNLFFPLDPELRKIEDNDRSEETAKIIFETVLARIEQVAPLLATKIKTLYISEIPFKNWIPIYEDLPLIEDELKYPLEPNQEKIQIASRRTSNIMYNVRAYAAMSPLNRAALWLHEYIYALSGLENSIKIQRAVSLFFSSEFLTIAQDIPKLTLIFHQLDLLGISRKSLEGSLPPGARLNNTRQSDNCGMLQKMEALTDKTLSFVVKLSDRIVRKNLDSNTAMVVASSVSWAKIFLETSFPIYKYYGQRIMPDQICFDADFKKITQVRSSLAIDPEMALATKNLADAEVEVYKLRTEIILEKDKQLQSKDVQDNLKVSLLLEKLLAKSMDLQAAQFEFNSQSLTSLDKILFPKILREYNISVIEP